MTLWLIGMMGSGKTSAGQLAASGLGVAFFDVDDEVVSSTGRIVAELWAELGEGAFRDLESAAIQRLAGEKAVVSTGGGAILDPRNRRTMKEAGPVIWLRASPDLLTRRVQSIGGRPLLVDTSDPRAELARLLEERTSIYSEAADHEIDTSPLSLPEVALRIEGFWRS